MKRRSFLASSSGLTILSAGCLSAGLFQDYSFTVMNGSRDSHSIRIRIKDDDANTTFQETFDMEGWAANESIPLDGVPSTVLVTIYSQEEQELAWPVESGDQVEEASVHYEPNLEAVNQRVYIRTVIA